MTGWTSAGYFLQTGKVAVDTINNAALLVFLCTTPKVITSALGQDGGPDRLQLLDGVQWVRGIEKPGN
jgi:hypothetical protein